MEHNNVERKARSKVYSAQDDLALAEQRLKDVQSDDVGPTIERAVWIGLAEAKLRAEQVRLNEIREAPFRPEDWQDSRRFAQWPGESAQEQSERFKRGKIPLDHNDAWGSAAVRNHSQRGSWQLRNPDKFKPRIERTDLTWIIQGEIRSATKRIDEAKKEHAKIFVRLNLLSALVGVDELRQMLEQHKRWIERQRQELLSTGSIITLSNDGQQSPDQANKPVHRSR